MGLEAGGFISDLNAAWPLGTDQKSTADDHLRLIKTALQATFLNFTAAVSASPAQLNTSIGNTSGSFTGTLTGFAAGPTGTVKYKVFCGMVCLYIEAAIQGTSNAATLTMTGMPAALKPLATREVPCAQLTNNSNASVAGSASIATSGTITFALTQSSPLQYAAGIFATSNTKGLGIGWCITYPV